MNYQDYPYTVEDISTICKRSKQAIYNLVKANREFINNNSITYQRKKMYNQDALLFFTNYYQVEAPEVDTLNETIKQEARSIEELQTEVKQLKEEVDTLKQLLEDKESERKELLQQNGALILTLQQEKQEKMLLLPAPRKTIGEWMKGLRTAFAKKIDPDPESK